ncbi:DUF5134 domain-containing protein [Nocardia harenae]|uniref:DUF5134 domain-containing protein n=1 Tax=Nocardia harenae TaxID=358707 RepID=UPI00082B72EC|nr:DUF5134 domain-containing protein [Nocardia harenae]
MGEPQQWIVPVTAALVAVSASALACRHPCAGRGRIAHGVLCLAMLAMLLPAYDPLGPLPWALALGGVGLWLADTPVPLALRLPVIADVLVMAVLLLAMPGVDGAVATPGAAHRHGGGAGPGWLSLPLLALGVWGWVRVRVWWAGRGVREPARSVTGTVAHLSMTAAMPLMGLGHLL